MKRITKRKLSLPFTLSPSPPPFLPRSSSLPPQENQDLVSSLPGSIAVLATGKTRTLLGTLADRKDATLINVNANIYTRDRAVVVVHTYK